MATIELRETHCLQLIEGSGISADVISEREYSSVDNPAVLHELGFSKFQLSCPGLLIPVRGVAGGVVGHIYRPDRPRTNAKGKVIKYEQPSGKGLRLDCPSRCQKDIGNPEVLLWITEGIKKGDALASHGACVIDLPGGVWGFKGRNRDGGTTVLVDWDHVALNGRIVHLTFDSDFQSNPQVFKALERLTGHLKQRGARVSWIKLPHDPMHKVGVDDYLLTHSFQELMALKTEPFESSQCQQTALEISMIIYHSKESRTSAKDLIDKIRHQTKMLVHDRKVLISQIVIADILENGKLIRNDLGRFFFDALGKVLMELDSFGFQTLLNDTYGLNPTEPECKFVLAELHTETHVRGEASNIRQLSRYDQKQNVLYVDRFDGMVYRLDGESIELVDNGTDGVLFLKQAAWKPYKADLSCQTEGLINELCVDNISFDTDAFAPLLPDEQRIVYSIWILTLFFGDLQPTKPILAFIGEKGSGKTTALRLPLKFLFGSQVDVTGLERDKEDAFIAAITHSPLVVFDNLDGKIPWINDRLATASTQCVILRRTLYTTNEITNYLPRCFIALTSRDPQFRRDDVADRLLLLKVKRRSSFTPESELLSRIEANRDAMWAELLLMLNKVLLTINQSLDCTPGEFRMSDWAALAQKIASGLGLGDVFQGILSKLSSTQATFAVQDDPIFQCLQIWLEQPSNLCRELEAKPLLKELAGIADGEAISWPYDSTISFGKRMRSIASNLHQLLGLTIREDRRKRKHYMFTGEPTVVNIDVMTG